MAATGMTLKASAAAAAAAAAGQEACTGLASPRQLLASATSNHTESTDIPHSSQGDASDMCSQRGRSHSSGSSTVGSWACLAAETSVSSGPSGGFGTDYTLKSTVLGSGVSGDVREAVCKHTGRKVAVKSFRRSTRAQRVWDHARNECRIHQALCHPHIVACEGVYGSDQAMHLVMEKLDGGDLFERIVDTNGFSEAAAASITIQLLRAVGFLHARRIVHRDLKPENVLFQEKHNERTVKLADFGFAIQRRGRQRLWQKCGTTQYVAPEVAAGSYDEKADMWSLGALVYVTLLAKQLFGSSDAKLLKKGNVASERFSESFQGLSGMAQDFVRSLVTLDPARRLGVREALEHPWLRLHAADELEAARQEVAAEFDTQQQVQDQEQVQESSVFAAMPCLSGIILSAKAFLFFP